MALRDVYLSIVTNEQPLLHICRLCEICVSMLAYHFILCSFMFKLLHSVGRYVYDKYVCGLSYDSYFTVITL